MDTFIVFGGEQGGVGMCESAGQRMVGVDAPAKTAGYHTTGTEISLPQRRTTARGRSQSTRCTSVARPYLLARCLGCGGTPERTWSGQRSWRVQAPELRESEVRTRSGCSQGWETATVLGVACRCLWPSSRGASEGLTEKASQLLLGSVLGAWSSRGRVAMETRRRSSACAVGAE